MCIFLDSSKIEEIKKWKAMDIIRGVTTNPTIMYKDGIKSLDEMKVNIKQIADVMDDAPVSVEVLSNTKDEMMQQAEEFSNIAYNINIKIPFHGPHGELENLEVIKELTEKGIEVNCTAMMSAMQCVAALLAGAKYVSLFGGRVNDMGYNATEEIKKISMFLKDREILEEYYLIIGSAREPLNIIEWLTAGADIITVPPNILEKALIHPRTKETVEMFLNDAKKLQKALK